MPGYARWEDALVAQAELMDFTASPMGQRYLNVMGAQTNVQTADPEMRKPEGFYPAMQYLTLKDADPIYVSADILDTVEFARESFEPEPVRLNDPFTQFGFALFPRAVLLPDHSTSRAEWLPVRAIAWAPIYDEDDPDVGSFWISYYTHVDDDRTYGVADGTIVTERDTRQMRRQHATLTLAHMFQWSFGDDPWVDIDRLAHVTGEEPEVYRARALAQVSLIQVFWKIAAQVFRAPERAPRGIWRDAHRRGIQHKDVTVIKLRRAREGREYEPTGRELTVRHVVRGYWRWQHFKDGKRQIWISPYIRGDESLPFKVTDRVFEFVR